MVADTLPADKFNWLGTGWDTFADSPKNKVVTFTTASGGSNSECKIFTCNSTREISDVLDVSGSVGYKSKSANIDAKASFLSEVSKQSNAITLLVKAKTTWTARVSEAAFSSSENAKAASKDASKLFDHAGDSYISEVTMGIEYYCAYQFVSTSEEHRRKIKAEIAGNVKSVDASLKTNIDKVDKASETSSTFYSTLCGGSGTLPQADGAPAFALALAEKASNNLSLLQFSTAPYSQLIDVPVGFNKIEEWRDAFTTPKWFTKSLKDIEIDAKMTLPVIRGVQSLYWFYGADNIKDNNFDFNADGCHWTIVHIQDWKKEFIKTKGQQPPKKPEIYVNKIQTPQANFRLVFPWTHGKDGGNPWSDFDDNFIYSYGYLKKWKARTGSVIDQLTLVYACRNPSNPKDPSKESTFERKHGWQDDKNPRGKEISPMGDFKPNEVGRFGCWRRRANDWRDMVQGMEVYLKGDPKPKVVGFGDNGDWKSEAVPNDCSLVGLAGRGADAIDSIGPVYVQFWAPVWTSLQIGER